MQKTAIKPILICTLDRAACKRLITVGKSLAHEQQRPLTLLSLQPQELVSPNTAEDIQIVYNIASGAGVEITVLFSDTPTLTLAVHAKQIDAATVIVDESDITNELFIKTLRMLLPDVAIAVVHNGGNVVTLPAAKKYTPHQNDAVCIPNNL